MTPEEQLLLAKDPTHEHKPDDHTGHMFDDLSVFVDTCRCGFQRVDVSSRSGKSHCFASGKWNMGGTLMMEMLRQAESPHLKAIEEIGQVAEIARQRAIGGS